MNALKEITADAIWMYFIFLIFTCLFFVVMGSERGIYVFGLWIVSLNLVFVMFKTAMRYEDAKQTIDNAHNT